MRPVGWFQFGLGDDPGQAPVPDWSGSPTKQTEIPHPVQFVVYEWHQGRAKGFTLVLEGPEGGYRIGGLKLAGMGRVTPVGRYPVDSYDVSQIRALLRKVPRDD